MSITRVSLLLVLGGHGIACAQTSGTFRATGEMKAARAGHTATLLNNGKVLVAGGTADYLAPMASAELYDPENGMFTATGGMTMPRLSHTATLLPDGRVLITGGGVSVVGGLIPSNGAEIYDPASGTFTATGNMIGNHACQQANLLGNGKVLVAGGYDAKGGVTSAELFDPSLSQFALTGSYTKDMFDLNSCQGASSSMLPDGRVLMVWQDNDAEIYDPGTGRFTTTAIAGGYNNGLPSATLLMDGRVLVAGGANDGGFVTRSELYSASTGTFAATENLTTGRAGHTANLLPDGSVLMAGTFRYGGGSLASAELYDPAAGAFAPTGEMSAARSWHTATLLPDGRVLVAGGSASGRAFASAEIYTPRVLVNSPMLFSVPGGGQGAVWHASSGELASPGTPAVAGEVLSLYTTGLGEGGRIPPQVAIGGRLAEVLYFGSAPGYAGYSQVNFRMPVGVAPGPATPLRLSYIGRASNEVTIGAR